MNAVTSLDQALADLKTAIIGDYVYYVSQEPPAGVTPSAVIQEHPATSYVISLEDAQKLGLNTSLVYTWITVLAESSLETVGLTSAIATSLNARSIPVNTIAGYHHDHLLVPKPLVEEAQEVLRDLSAQAKGWLPPA